MQATVDTPTIQGWWAARPEASVILVTGRVFDVLDIPAEAGTAALAGIEAAGITAGPVAATGGRMLFFVTTRGAPIDEDEMAEEVADDDGMALPDDDEDPEEKS